MKIVLKVILALAVIIGGYTSISWANSEEIDYVKVGDKVPSFELKGIQATVSAENL